MFERIKSKLKHFGASQSGAIALYTGLAAIPLMFAVGAAVDMIRYDAAETHVQSSLDAAALAAATGTNMTDAQRIAAAEASFAFNIANGVAANMPIESKFEVINGKIVSKAHLSMPTAIMHLAGISKMQDLIEAEVGILQDKKAEIALVLDYSGSMGETVGGKVKYVAMREAAKNLVNDLSASDPTKVKFAVVPFSHHVYTTLPGAYVVSPTGGTWTGCTQDRQYPYNLTDATPTGDAKTKWGQPNAPEHAAWGCAGYVSNNLSTMSLSDKFSAINAKLDSMKPYAYTHIALGVEFGYHMLSHNEPFTEAAEYSDKNVRKFMVVLTDGMQTEPAFGPGSSRNVTAGEKNLESLCTAAKNNGITIITMAFDLDDSKTRKRLQNCATDGAKNFFVVNDPAGLDTAFDSVKQAVTAQIFLSK